MEQSPILNQLVRQSPPKILYHYTNQDGLIGIFSTWEMWATKIQYLNDTSEFDLTLKLARTYLAEYQDDPSPEKKKGIGSVLVEIDRIKDVNIFVASFSEKRDSLSQWRGYGRGNASYSIGFPTAILQQTATNGNFLLVKCVYDKHQQEQIVREHVEWALSDPKRLDQSKGFSNFVTQLFRIAPLLKNSHFQDESEWRIISGVIGATHPMFGFHRGPSLIIPHFRLALELIDKNRKIEEVVVGPCPHMNLADDAVTMLCFADKIKVQDIKLSEIPYRNW